MNPLKQKSEGLMISSPCVVEKPADGHFARETHAGWVSRWERQLSSALINGKTKSFYHFGLVETALRNLGDHPKSNMVPAKMTSYHWNRLFRGVVRDHLAT